MLARKNPTSLPNSTGGYRIRPYGNMILAPEGSMWEEYKAPLRKCSHSCIFRRFVL